MFTLEVELGGMSDRPRLPPLLFQGRAPRVLLADDHALNREVSRLMMEASGCQLAVVGDGQAAVDAVQAGEFDVIVMDVRMPGVDGLEATRLIRQLDGSRARTPIIALTADALPKDVARCHDAGCDMHLPKPASQADIHAALLQALDRASGTPA